MALPSHIKYLIIGAGVHGLSTAYHLACELRARGKGSGNDILVVDKTAIAAGASGIACGVIRNNYFQPAMRELMADCVAVWESDPKAFSYHPVGYMQISPECMHSDVAQIAHQQKDIGYASRFIEGEADCMKYMKRLLRRLAGPGHHLACCTKARAATPTTPPRCTGSPARPKPRACASSPASR